MKNAVVAALGLLIVGCGQPQEADVGVAVEAETARTPSHCSIVYHSGAVIPASVDRIWDTLVDLPRYAEWNPWVVRAEGKIEPDAPVSVDVMLNGRKMAAQHVVLTVEPKTSFCWRDAGWNSLFVYGQRCRWLTPQPDGTVEYKVELLLDGPLDFIAALTEGSALQSGMDAETAALVERVKH